MRFNIDHTDLGAEPSTSTGESGLEPGRAVIVRGRSLPFEGDEFLICEQRIANVAKCQLAVASDLG